MQTTHLVRNIVAALAIVLVAGVLIGSTRWTPAKEAPVASPIATSAIPTPMVGTPTGEFENGVPVYRLPSVAVTVSRSEALARIAREDQLATK